jgi:cell wall-associated NlpC family hydrolase
MKTFPVASSLIAACTAAACLFAFAPTATAAEGTITSTKSFPSYSQVRKDLTAEATSTDVENDSDWGGIENLDVPQTESQSEKDAAAAAKKAEEDEAAAKAQAQAQEQAQAASRDQSRDSIDYVDSGATVSGDAGASIDRAYSLIGQNMSCTALVTAALAARGINFSGWPEDYAHVPGGQVVTDGSLQPGDILIYAYTGGYNGGAHYDHVALYVGNGQAIHGGYNGYTVALASAMMNKVSIVVRIP